MQYPYGELALKAMRDPEAKARVRAIVQGQSTDNTVEIDGQRYRLVPTGGGDTRVGAGAEDAKR